MFCRPILAVLVGLLLPHIALAQTAPDQTAAGELGDAGAGATAPGQDPVADLVFVPQEFTQSNTAVDTLRNTGQQDDTQGFDRAVTQQLRDDLALTGYFRVLPNESFGLVDRSRDGVTASSVDFDGWQDVGASFVIKGIYEIQGGKIKLDLRLFDAVARRQIKLKWQPRTVSMGNYRGAVHDFVNAMVEHMTGTSGPLGSALLFTGLGGGNNRRLHMMALGNKGPGTLVIPRNLNVLPSWGPKGSVLFTTFGERGSQIMKFEPREEKLTVLTQYPGINSGAAYCPSKDLLALTLSFEGNPEIYTMRPDGSELTRITVNDANDTTPTWAPGCRTMAFVSDREGDPQIYTMRANGSGVKRLTYLGDYNTAPEWSPSGKPEFSWIAFTARDERNRFDIFLIRPDGTEITRITQDQGHNEEPTWSPDGRYLVFQSTRDGREPRLYMTRVDTFGSFQVRITDGFGYRTPRWQR